MNDQPKITVGITDRQTDVTGRFDGQFRGEGFGPVSGPFSAKTTTGVIVLNDESHREICRSPLIKISGTEDSTFRLFNVIIGNRFHWERREDQTFPGRPDSPTT